MQQSNVKLSLVSRSTRLTNSRLQTHPRVEDFRVDPTGEREQEFELQWEYDGLKEALARARDERPWPRILYLGWEAPLNVEGWLRRDAMRVMG